MYATRSQACRQFLCQPGRREFAAAGRILAGPHGRQTTPAGGWGLRELGLVEG
jgi:hypothetical protein